MKAMTVEQAEPRVVEFKPSTWYFRQGIRASKSKAELEAIALHLCCELDRLKQWTRDHDLIPPKWNIMSQEIADKGLTDGGELGLDPDQYY